MVETVAEKRDRSIVQMRLGLPPFERKYTLSAIAAKYHLTTARVSQIVTRELENGWQFEIE